MRLRDGKRAVEVLAPLTINKGQALRRYVAEQKLSGVLFAGDDLTDLDAMLETERLRQEGFNARSIVVQHPDTRPELLKHADSAVQGVEEMALLLAEIVAYLANTHAVA
jgi:trehalose 6-phosphate phosphatase